MDETNAWFCVTKEDIDVYDLSKYPFINSAQYLTAKELVILPIWSLIKLSRENVRSDVDMILFFHSARCGSTLNCKMFDKLPKTR